MSRKTVAIVLAVVAVIVIVIIVAVLIGSSGGDDDATGGYSGTDNLDGVNEVFLVDGSSANAAWSYAPDVGAGGGSSGVWIAQDAADYLNQRYNTSAYRPATVDEVIAAHRAGAQICYYGWIADPQSGDSQQYQGRISQGLYTYGTTPCGDYGVDTAITGVAGAGVYIYGPKPPSGDLPICSPVTIDAYGAPISGGSPVAGSMCITNWYTPATSSDATPVKYSAYSA